MSPVNDATLFLLNTLFGLYAYALIARFLLQALRVDFYNPLAQFVWKVSNPVVRPAQAVIPRWRRYDLATLLVLWLWLLINIALVLAVLGVPLSPAIALLAVAKMLVLLINFYTFAILIQAVMSWFGAAMHGPAASLLYTLNEPLLRPVRRVLPPIGGLDLSPLLVIIALQVLSRLIPLAYVLR